MSGIDEVVSERLATVLRALRYDGSDGLVVGSDSLVPLDRLPVWDEAERKLGLDGAYFHGNVPLVYFKEFEAFDDGEVADLRNSLWNHNRAPLLIAVDPSEVRVYNCFAPPPVPAPRGLTVTDREHSLLRSTRLTADLLELRRELRGFGRHDVDSGRFAHGREDEFGQRQRVDHRLLQNLSTLRRELISDGLDAQLVNTLLGRAIFVRYLEDRGVLKHSFFSRFHTADSFRELLQASWKATYQVFDELAQRFNGDLFPVDTAERRQVRASHLQRLGRFLAGDEVTSGQMYFWAYDFRYIPIELISAIYEAFLKGHQETTSAYYTPPELVEYVLSQLLPIDGASEPIRILDPACGSGVFLVQAYRRLVLRRQVALGRRLSAAELKSTLTESIDGVDVHEDAIGVAAFSCYLALLDFLEPKSIWEELVFPKLKENNLFVADFFDASAPFNRRRYGLIVGNPPWQSKLSNDAKAFLKESKRHVGDQQFAQAFLWRAPELLASGGSVCLLAPSKAVLYNQSNRNKAFRREFFASYDVTSLVDFSLFRRSMFRNAVAPMVTVSYRAFSHSPTPSRSIRYSAPRPSPFTASVHGIAISGDEVTSVSKLWAIERSDLWKVLLLGTKRDAALIEDLRHRFPALRRVAGEHDWIVHEGFQVQGGDENVAPELARMRYVPADAIRPFVIEGNPSERIGTEVFHRPRDRRIYRGPHVMVREGVVGGGVLAAAFLEGDAAFRATVIGIAGPPSESANLRALCAILNSSLARYYHLLTASSWGVERPVIRPNEHLQLPLAMPRSRAELRQFVQFVDRVATEPNGADWRQELDELVFDAYELTTFERHLVADAMSSSLDQLHRGLGSRAFTPPESSELESYASAFDSVFEATTGHRVHHYVYVADAPYCIVSFSLGGAVRTGNQQVISRTDDLERELVRLEGLTLEQQSVGIYLRRNIRIFEPDAVHIVKPAERRFWTRTAGYNDADSTSAEVARAGRTVGR